MLKKVQALYAALETVREKNTHHPQGSIAVENLNHLFKMQASVNKTIQWIKEGTLLHANQCLSDVEHSLDELLFKIGMRNPSEHSIPVGNVRWYILARTKCTRYT